jgi:hypothetical protein
MVKLRDAFLSIALVVGGTGCVTFCDECDDFPSPGGPRGYSLMPGSYSGPALSRAPDAEPVTPPAREPDTASTPTAPGEGDTVPLPPLPPTARTSGN